MTTTMTSELTSVNPASGEPVGHVTITPVDEIPAILQRAHDAQSHWAAMSIEQRIKTLTALIPAFEARAQELGQLVTNEMGNHWPKAWVRWSTASMDLLASWMN